MLHRNVFNTITQIFGKPEKDLFAPRVNNQVEFYYSWRADPNAKALDAFKQSWRITLNYLFPPFSIIALALQKISQEEAEAILVAPVWPTQTWFPGLLKMLIDCPLLLSVKSDLVSLPDQTTVHPLKNKHMAVFRISGKIARARIFKRGYPHDTAVMEK